MLELLPESAGNVVAIKATGRLTDADYKEFLPRLEEIMARAGRVRLLADLQDLEGWDLRAAWDDFAFGVKHWNDFDRIALVGDKKWEEIAARMADRLMKAEVRIFGPSEKGAAWDWIKS